jgi:hypothetical protein
MQRPFSHMYPGGQSVSLEQVKLDTASLTSLPNLLFFSTAYIPPMLVYQIKASGNKTTSAAMTNASIVPHSITFTSSFT